VVLEK